MSAKLAILDPNLSSLNSIKTVLKDFTCHVFTHPKEVLDKIEKEPFDLLISEWELPSLTGDELCRKVGEINPNIFILFLSSVRDPETKIKALQSGAIDFIAKPFDRDFLLAKLKSTLRVTQNLRRPKDLSLAQNNNPMDQLIRHLKEKNSELTPQFDRNSPFGYFYNFDFLGIEKKLSVEAQIEMLEDAVGLKYLNKKIFDIINICHNCHSYHINLRDICINCRTPILKNSSESFCSNCFSEKKKSEKSYHCLNCGAVFGESEADSQVFYAYFLNQRDFEKSDEKSKNYLLFELARELGFNMVQNKSFEEFLSDNKSSEEGDPEIFSVLQIKFLNIPSLTMMKKNLKKLNHILLILKKIVYSNHDVFFLPPNILCLKLSVASIQEAEEQKKRFRYYLNQFELSQLVEVQLSKEELGVVLGFLEKDFISEEGLP